MPENTAVTDSDVTHSAGFTQVSKKKQHRFVLLLSCGQGDEVFFLIREENLQTATRRRSKFKHTQKTYRKTGAGIFILLEMKIYSLGAFYKSRGMVSLRYRKKTLCLSGAALTEPALFQGHSNSADSLELEQQTERASRSHTKERWRGSKSLFLWIYYKNWYCNKVSHLLQTRQIQ